MTARLLALYESRHMLSQQHRSVRRLSSGGTAPASHPPLEPPVPGRGRWPYRPGIRCPERLVPVNIRQERAAATRDHRVGTGLGGPPSPPARSPTRHRAGTGCWLRPALNPAVTAQ
jgi:hypothetical protein